MAKSWTDKLNAPAEPGVKPAPITIAGMPIEAITPFWRVLDGQSPTTGRLPNGVAFVAARRAAEG